MKLLHLYHDIMNLYGDYANIVAMESLLKKSGHDVEVCKRSLGDDVKLSDYDFIYIGSGTERNQKVVLKDIMRFGDDLRKCIDSGKVILMTGNSFEMLGKSVTDSSGKVFEGLGIFPFTAVEQNKTRQTGDAIFTMEGSDKKLVGFINKCSSISGIEAPLFGVEMGLPDNDNVSTEGIRKNNFFGTHLTGPVLMKNPYFLIYMASLIPGADSSRFSADLLPHETAGYEVTLSELTKRIGEKI